VRHSRVRERIEPGEGAAAAAERLAREKAIDVARRCRAGRILGADTLVVSGREILGKPRNTGDARRMLRQLSGRTHRVITGVALCAPGGRVIASTRSITQVRFRRLSRADIDWYLATGDPMDKAGAYGIQSGAGLFITEIRGSYSNVVGLPMDVVCGMLGLPA